MQQSACKHALDSLDFCSSSGVHRRRRWMSAADMDKARAETPLPMTRRSRTTDGRAIRRRRRGRELPRIHASRPSPSTELTRRRRPLQCRPGAGSTRRQAGTRPQRRAAQAELYGPPACSPERGAARRRPRRWFSQQDDGSHRKAWSHSDASFRRGEKPD